MNVEIFLLLAESWQLKVREEKATSLANKAYLCTLVSGRIDLALSLDKFDVYNRRERQGAF